MLGKSRNAPVPISIEKPALQVQSNIVSWLSGADKFAPRILKMKEYQCLGVRLGLLIDPKNQHVEIYRPEQEPQILAAPQSIDCGEVMPGFILNMSRIW
jgi:Uma2 family endonuclease